MSCICQWMSLSLTLAVSLGWSRMVMIFLSMAPITRPGPIHGCGAFLSACELYIINVKLKAGSCLLCV